jgi:septal ring factor EnvC (AmiA/AmiB activator)
MAADSLAKANASRHRAAVVAAHSALERLCREGGAVNFGAVSRAAGVSRTWLYRQADLRESIGRLRSSTPPAPCAEANTQASISSLRQRLESAKAEISRLRAENSALRDQLARQLGAQRAHQTGRSVSSPR